MVADKGRGAEVRLGLHRFRSIRWRILNFFILLILSIIIFVGSVLFSSITNYYLNAFVKDMGHRVFTEEFVKELEAWLAEDDALENILQTLEMHSSSRMRIDASRGYYVLDGRTGAICFSSDGEDVETTNNIFLALQGERGELVNPHISFMDYAIPLKLGDNVEYIVYVRDKKVELENVIKNLYIIILYTLGIGLALFVGMGLFIARTITAPIAHLKARAERLASGDFNVKHERFTSDEIGDLARTFDKMATDLRKMVLQNYNERLKLETIMRYQADGIIAFDDNGKIIHMNPAAEQIISIEQNEDFERLFSRVSCAIELKSLLYLEQHTTIIKIINYKDKHIKAVFAPFKNEDESVGGVVVVLTDVAEEQKLENARREFVANVSHELRTPLTTIRTYTETLLESVENDPFTQQFLTTILGETERLTRIVRDLLTLSKLDYGKNVRRNESFDVEKLLRNVTRKLSIDAQNSQGVTLNYRSTGESIPFWGDMDRIEQVFNNIITNSCKYTPRGGTVDISCEFALTNMIVRIKDTGIGIPKADLPRIFERFYRVDEARSREFGGTGLGLAIAKEIVDMHDGTIEIFSDLGKGTEVCVTFPYFRA